MITIKLDRNSWQIEQQTLKGNTYNDLTVCKQMSSNNSFKK